MMEVVLGPMNAIISLVSVIALFVGCIVLTYKVDSKKIRFRKGGR
jgi:hypothetical protein